MTAPIESNGSIKFDDQTFLISYFSDIVKHDTNDVESFYQNTFKINNNTAIPISQLISIFNGTSNLSSFLKLSTYQYAALIPRIKLYRIDYDEGGKQISDKEFIFEKDYKYELDNIFNPIIRNNSGIKRVNWRLAGTNPVSAEKQVEVELEIYFDSINAFSGGNFDDMKKAWIQANAGYNKELFKDFDTDTTTKNYWSLIFHPKIDEADETSSARERYDTNFFRIRANVGWEEVEQNVVNQLFPKIDINEEIKKLNYSFLLNLSEHKFNFSEDGSLTLVATYFAQFENSLHNYNYNLLGPLKKSLEIMRTFSIGDVYKRTGVVVRPFGFLTPATDPSTIIDDLGIQLTDEEKENFNSSLLDLSINDVQQINEVLTDSEKFNCLIKSVPIDTPQGTIFFDAFRERENFINNNAASVIGDKFSKITDVSNEIFSIASSREKGFFYKEFFTSLISLEKIKTIKISKKVKEDWEKWVTGNAIKPSFDNNVEYIDQNEITARAQDEEIKINSEIVTALTDNQGTLTLDQTSTTLRKAGVGFTNDTKHIAYISLGDIIESVFLQVTNGLNGSTEYSKKFNLIPSQLDKRAVVELQRVNVVCGNLSNDTKILDINKKTEEQIFMTGGRNILDVPIDLKLLKLFLIENIIKPQKDTYSLFSFIRDIITKLVVGALNGSNLYNSGTDVYGDTSLATTIFTLGDNSTGINPFPQILSPSINENKPKTLETIIKSYYINNINKHTNYYNYFLIYDKNFKDFYPNSNIEVDESMGIYHYTVGEDYGLLKAANFSRIDTPYLKEAKAVGRKTFYLGQFRDRYSVDLTMVGNNIYYPGMMLYIQPSAEAVQSVDETKPEDNPSFSQITGIGGYYFVEKVDSTISEEGYETKLSCIWQYAGDEKPPETIDGNAVCNVQFNNINSDKIFSLLLTKLQNDAELKKNQQQCDKSKTCDDTILDIIVGAF